jgi:hypothetical protein
VGAVFFGGKGFRGGFIWRDCADWVYCKPQAVLGLTTVPPDAFQGSGRQFTTYGECV